MKDASLLELAARLALKASDAILAIRARGFEISRKADRSVVTKPTMPPEAILSAGLREAAPDIPVIARKRFRAVRSSPPRSVSGWSIRWMARGSSLTATTISLSMSAWCGTVGLWSASSLCPPRVSCLAGSSDRARGSGKAGCKSRFTRERCHSRD